MDPTPTKIEASVSEQPRGRHEIQHGKKLAGGDPERTWGWATPAGERRAARRAALIMTGAGLAPGMRVLEVGCGTGLFTEKFAASGAHILAVDISPELVDLARRRGLPEGNVEFVAKPFEACREEGPFDAVVGSSILHHLDVPEAVRAIFDLLKPGRPMCFAEPNMLNPQIAIQKNVPWLKARLGDSPDETAFVRWRLANLLLQTGFTEVDIRPFDWLHPATPRAFIGLVSATGRVLEACRGLREFAGSLIIRAIKPHTPGRA